MTPSDLGQERKIRKMNELIVTKVLTGHVSMETSFVVSDYPYGAYRCRIRYWLESSPSKGYRFCSQTEHPRKLIWNAPKKSTYVKVAGAMYLDEKGHVTWAGLGEYSSEEDYLKFISHFFGALSPETQAQIVYWINGKIKFLQDLISEKKFFTIGGVKESPSAFQKDLWAKEVLVWQECQEKCKKVA
jgi:hypothetical protein